MQEKLQDLRSRHEAAKLKTYIKYVWFASAIGRLNLEGKEGVCMRQQAAALAPKHGLRKDFRKNRALYVMILPGLALLIVFKYFPMYGLIAAFQDYNPFRGYFGSPMVGFKHFERFFRDPYCWRLIRNTFLLGAYHILWTFPAAILLALVLNELRYPRFKRVVQTISYMPYFLSTVIVVGMMKSLFSSTGIFNEALLHLGIVDKGIAFFAEPEWFRTLYISSALWQGVGYNSIIYLGAMANINTELYESATIDGANRVQQIVHITVPGILPTIMILFILAMAGILGNDYQKILLMYSPRTYSTADVISTYVYRQGIETGGIAGFSYSTAVGLISTVVSLVFLLVTNLIVSKVGETSLF